MALLIAFPATAMTTTPVTSQSRHEVDIRMAVIFGVVLAGCACSGVGAQTGGDIPPVWAQAAIVAAEGLRQDIHHAPIAVDPRPARIVGRARMVPSSPDYYDDISAEPLTRLLAEAGIPTAEALPVRERCTGQLVPPPHRDVEKCPAELEMDVVLDLVREEEGQPTIMAAVIGYRPNGRFVSITKIWLHETDQGYVYDRREVLMEID